MIYMSKIGNVTENRNGICELRNLNEINKKRYLLAET